MRVSLRGLTQICIDTLVLPEPIYEFGSYQVPGQEEIIDLRSMFKDRQYVGADIRKGPGVDVVLDLHNIDLADESVGTVLLIDTLEHVEFVRRAVEECYRILKPNGVLIMSSTMDFPIHAYPNDYWRFTPAAFESLLQDFSSFHVHYLGRKTFPHTVIGLGFKGPMPEERVMAFEQNVEAWKRRWRWRLFLGWKEFVRRVLPPVLMELYIDWRTSGEG